METPDDVATMLRLHEAGWGAKRIAVELGCSRNTVRRYLRQGGWARYANPGREKTLDAHQTWVEAAFDTHQGNAEVVRQELARAKGVHVSLRTVERAVVERRRRLRAEEAATVRFETPPGKQLQVDFGERFVTIAGERQKVFLCVITLGYSRRIFVRAYKDERQANWLDALEGAFAHFGGVPEDVLVDNARALVTEHNVETREVRFSERFRRFAEYWKFRPRACAPYRARTKGKDERSVGYVKRNAIAGRDFASWAALDAWLVEWTRTVSDERLHGTTGERPLVRFQRDEAAKLRPINDRPPFLDERSLDRRVHKDACVEVDANWYSVPWRLAGCSVRVVVRDRQVLVHHEGNVVASHDRAEGRRVRVVDEKHWDGLVRKRAADEHLKPMPESEFVSDLAAYASIVEAA
jgi:transposase